MINTTFYLCLAEGKSAGEVLSFSDVNWRELLKWAVPGLLYFCDNLIGFYILLHLSAVSIANLGIELFENLSRQGNIVAETLRISVNISAFARSYNICYGCKFRLQEVKNVSEYLQKLCFRNKCFPYLRQENNFEKRCSRDNVSLIA